MKDDDLRKEALHYAAQDGDIDKVRELIKTGGDLNQFDYPLSWTPLHYAANGEHIYIARMLIDAGADVNAHNEVEIGETPLGLIAASCSYDIAKVLIDAGADPRIPGWMGISALDRASERKKPEGRSVYELLDVAARKLDWPNDR